MKKILIIMLILSVVFVSGCSIFDTTPESITEEISATKTEYFDFTVNEFVENMKEMWLVDLELLIVTDDIYDENLSTAAYLFKTSNDTDYTMMHYHIIFNNITNKVHRISFNFDKNFMGDLSSARTRFRYHIGAISEIIDPNADVDAIHEKLLNVDGINEGIDGISTYECDKFFLFASGGNDTFDAWFSVSAPSEK